MRVEPRRVRHRDPRPEHRPLEGPAEVTVAGEPQAAALGVADAQPLDGRRVLLTGLRHAVTPELDDLPRRLHALGGRLALAAFASATTIATAIAVPETTESTPRLVTASVLAVSAVASWASLLVWHWFGQGKPLKLTPLLRFFRR